MCDNESAEKVKNHGTQDIFLPKTQSPDIIVEMEATADSKVETSKDSIENKEETDITAKPIVNCVDLSNICIEDTKIDIDKKQSIRDVKENNEKCLQNSNFITLQVFDTYYGQQEASQLPHRQPQIYTSYGVEDEVPFATDPNVRRRFIKLTFTIVLLMIIVTSVIIGICMATDSIKFIMHRHHKLLYVIGAGLLLMSHYSMYFSSCARVPPCNIIFLMIAIAAYCIMAGNLSVRYKTQIVFYGILATAACVFICILLACTNFDFTSWLIYVVIIGAVFSAVSAILLVNYLVTHNYPRPLHIAMLIGGTLLQVITLIIQLQMILGGKSVELNEDDYALGAFMLYTSIMTLFMNTTHLFGYAS